MVERINRILESLKHSSFRSRFKLTNDDRKYIDNKGFKNIRSHAFDFITSRVAPESPKNDGRQTPMRGHPVFIAQHATATCCRGCIEKWHGIKKGIELTDQEVNFIVDLIMAWIKEQRDIKV